LMLAVAHSTLDNNSCTNLGVWRSINQGVTWTLVLRGSGLEIEGDPNDLNRFYSVVDYTMICSSLTSLGGIFTSADEGATWTATAEPRPGQFTAEDELNNAKLTVSADTSRVWAALLLNGQVNSISYSDDRGTSWTVMDEVATLESNGEQEGLNPREKPGGQGSVHFSLLASDADRDIIYVGGDRQDFPFPNFIGAQDFSGRLFRGDATIVGTGAVPSPQWFHLTHSNSVAEIIGGGTASSSAPHADSRDMEWRADGVILEANDGGIAIRSSPSDNTGDWYGLCGNMMVYEAHHVAYDPFFNAVFFGNQDTGSIRHVIGSPNSALSITTADGNRCFADYTTDPDFVWYYGGTQNLGTFYRAGYRKTTGNFEQRFDISLPVNGHFLSAMAMNPANQAILAYQSSSNTIIAVTLDRAVSFTQYSSNVISNFEDIFFTDDGNFLYAFTGSDFVKYSFNPVTGVLALIFMTSISGVRRGAVDPSNSNIVYAVGGNRGIDYVRRPFVFRSLDGGLNWEDVTVTNSLVDTASTGGAAVFVGSVCLVGTSNGILIAEENTAGTITGWISIAEGLPKAIVTHMVYDITDGILVISTMGRGIWYLEEAMTVVTAAGSRRLGASFRSIKVPPKKFPDNLPKTNYVRRVQAVVIQPDDEFEKIPPDDFPDPFIPVPLIP